MTLKRELFLYYYFLQCVKSQYISFYEFNKKKNLQYLIYFFLNAHIMYKVQYTRLNGMV